jgi:hypothetical protein
LIARIGSFIQRRRTLRERENKKGEKRHKDIKVIKQMRKRERER